MNEKARMAMIVIVLMAIAFFIWIFTMPPGDVNYLTPSTSPETSPPQVAEPPPPPEITTENASAEMTDFVPAERLLSINGKVVDGKGKPIGGAVVWVYSPGYKGGTQTSDRRGHFTLDGLTPFSEIEVGTNEKYYVPKSTEVVLQDQSVTDLVIALEMGGWVKGKVVDENKEPISDFNVVMIQDTEERLGEFARTNAEGRFEMAGVSPGKYEFGYTNINNERIVWGVYDISAENPIDGIQFTVKKANTDILTISGTVRDDLGTPIEGVEVEVPGAGSYIYGRLPKTDAMGKYIVTKLKNKNYFLRLKSAGHESKLVHEIRGGSENVDVVLARTASVSGRVLDAATGEPIEKFRLKTEPFNRSSSKFGGTAIQNPNGEYIIHGAHTNIDLNLMVRAQGYADFKMPIGSVRPAETLGGITALMEAPNSLLGTVVDSEGKSVSGAYVFKSRNGLQGLHDAQHLQFNHGITDANGEFELNDLPKGPLEVSIYKEGFSPETILANVVQSETPIRITLYNGTVFTGTVLLNGEPLPNAEVTVRIKTNVSDKTVHDNVKGITNEYGRFEFRGVMAGTAKVTVIKKDGDIRLDLVKTIEFPVNSPVEEDFDLGDFRSVLEGYLLVGPNEHGQGRVQVASNTVRYTMPVYGRTDKNGFFRVEGVRSGDITVYAQLDDAPQHFKVFQQRIDANETVRVDIPMYGGTTIEVSLKNISTEGEQLVVLLPDTYKAGSKQYNTQMLAAVTTIGGLATLRHIEPGTYKIMALARDGSKAKTKFKEITIRGESVHEIEISF